MIITFKTLWSQLLNRVIVEAIKLSAYFDRPEVVALLAKPDKAPKQVADPGQPRAMISTSQGMPQDIQISPTEKTFFVADRMAGGLHHVDLESFLQIGFITTAQVPRLVPDS